jgi:hypothetical protein
MSALLSSAEYKEFLMAKKMSELKNMITTIVKHIRFTLTGKRKNELVDHLMEHTRFNNNTKTVILMRDLESVNLPEGGVRDTSVTASGAPRKPRDDKGKIKIKESKNIEKVVVPMSTKKVVKDSEKMKSDKAKLDMMVKQEAAAPAPKQKKKSIGSMKPAMVMTSLPVPKMLPTVAETNYVKPAPPTKKPRKPRIKKEKTI